MATPEPEALATRMFVLVALGCLGFVVASLIVLGG